MITVALLTAVVPFLLLYLLRDYRESSDQGETQRLPTPRDSIAVMKTPVIWLIAVILFCTYSLCVGLTFFTPYLSYAFHISDETSGTLTIIRSFVFMSLTPLTGLFADKIAKSTLRWFLIACPIVALSLAGVVWLGDAPGRATAVIALTMLAAFFVCSIYASMFSIVSECRIPMSIAGTAIGLVSIFSSTPDIVMQPLFGHFVDVNRYGAIFLTLVVMALVSFGVAPCWPGSTNARRPGTEHVAAPRLSAPAGGRRRGKEGPCILNPRSFWACSAPATAPSFPCRT